jgi:hypothetical protein
VRRALMPLKAMAARTGCAVVLVRHLNKDSRNSKAIYRGGGSIGFVGACRSALLLAADPDDEELRVVAVVKGNLAPDSWKTSIQFRLESVSEAAARVAWEGESSRSGDDLLQPPDLRDGAGKDAEEWLEEKLAEGPVLSSELETARRAADIATATYKRARKRLGVKASEQRFSGRWESCLPGKGIK